MALIKEMFLQICYKNAIAFEIVKLNRQFSCMFMCATFGTIYT